jgi:capsular exopolysaccharide synthesis family protein
MQPQTGNVNSKQPQNDDSLRIQDIFYICLAKWQWFLISVMLVLGVAVFYLLRTPAVYTRTASVLIKEDSKGNSVSSDIADFSDLGLFQSGINVNNELFAFQSSALMMEVVKRMNLDVNYYLPGLFNKKVAYWDTLPAIVSFIDFPDNESVSFKLEILPNDSVVLSDIIRGEDKFQNVKGLLSDTIQSPLGCLCIEPTVKYQKGTSHTLYVTKSNLKSTQENYSGRLSVLLVDKKASVINLSLDDHSIQRAEDVLSTLIALYNANWVKDKNQIAISTSQFINERLKLIEQELGSVDNDLSSYKSKNLISDVQAVSDMYMKRSNDVNNQILALNNQLYMTRYVQSYLSDMGNKMQLIPANSGIENPNLEAQISEYNKQLLQRNSVVANSSETNPLVVNMDSTLASLRKAVMRSIANQIIALEAQISSLEHSEEENISRIAANPNQAKYLLSVERQQKVKESLYIFLLQKREENQLSQAFTAYNTRIITPPDGKMIPTAPVRKKIILMALIIGLMIPAAIIYLKEMMNTTIRGRKDLEKLTVPFLGEIPLWWNGKKKKWFSKPEHTEKFMLVAKDNRDVINEAFRVVRANLEFMTESKSTGNVFLITSFNIGSGKSFISMNLAKSLAISDKKVLVIDGDFRHATASAYVNSPIKGVSDYLNGKENQIDKLLVSYVDCEKLKVLPVGTIPPNPSELLMNDRFKQLIDTLRSQFDYILIDCPPVEIVADAQIIEKQADRTLFVIRAGIFERTMLPELEAYYKENKFKNMAVILNGTHGIGNRYGYNKYGYHYGYRYGYNYGYHYGSKNSYGYNDSYSQKTKI